MSKFFNRQRALRWLREGVMLLVIGAAIVWGVDQYRQPALPDTFSGVVLPTIDG